MPPAGIDPILGTNPLAIGIPTATDRPLVVDLATSSLAFGAVWQARRRGGSLPEGAAVDSEGRPTCDPAAAVTGALTAFGGHKGFGLSLCVGLLAGPLDRRRRRPADGAASAGGADGPIAGPC